MKKRILALLLALCFLLPLASCKKIVPTNPEDLPTFRTSTSGETAYFAVTDSNAALSLSIPIQWTLDDTDGSYVIKEDGADIGRVIVGEITENADAMTEAKSETKNDVLMKTFIGVLDKGGEKAAWYRIAYKYTDDEGTSRTITFEIKESAMDTQLYKWLSSPKAMPIKDYHKIPSISLDGTNGKKTIAILGNSFVYDRYSGIRIILTDMLRESNKDWSVTVKGIGYATIAKYAAAQDSDYKTYLNNIKNGAYGIVFMCGLYSDADVAALQTIYDACKSSKTKLVLFPAHNENSPQLENAMLQYPDVTCLNWRNEIDGLIDAGVDRSDMCEQDDHSHSKALAGYVGARMIYQSLFGEEPPALSKSCSVLTMETVTEKLGGISIAPTVLIPQKKIRYLT